MNNTVLLQDLNSLKKQYEESSYFDSLLLDKIMEKVKEEISMEKIKTPQEKQALKKALAYLKKASDKGSRSILSYAHKTTLNDNKEYYVFSNSYTLYALKENKGLPLIKEQKEDIGTYPKVERIVPLPEDGKKVEIIDYKTLVKIIKQNPDYLSDHYIISRALSKNSFIAKIYSQNFGYICFDAMFLKETFEILATNELTCYVYGCNKPLLFKNNNGDMAIILPLKKEIENKCYDISLKQEEE